MVSYELFKNILDKLEQDQMIANKLDFIFRESKNDFIDGSAFLNCDLTSLTIELLDKSFHPDCDWVSYYIYEINFGKNDRKKIVIYNTRRYVLDSPLNLYNFIIKYFDLDKV